MCIDWVDIVFTGGSYKVRCFMIALIWDNISWYCRWFLSMLSCLVLKGYLGHFLFSMFIISDGDICWGYKICGLMDVYYWDDDYWYYWWFLSLFGL